MSDLLQPLPDEFATTRAALQRVAVHIVARARSQATGRFGLRVTPGGFGTPEFGDDLRRVRVSGRSLVVEQGPPGGAASRVVAIDGASLLELAATAEVDLDAPLDVGHDTPELGDRTVPLAVDRAAADALAVWYSVVASGLDRAVGELGEMSSPTMVQLWPEHFDVGVDVAARPDVRVNLGGSPGDGFEDRPYAYVGPWTDDRPGDPTFWNAPFGAVLAYDDVTTSDDPVGAIAAFLVDGVRRQAD
jgi:hypothetical protein